ncbi:MAG: type II toxin-antitoxin system PemK/MazF family toxin, partial [Actinobacteria bacterium]|nr:type II toxin-antitoxin system PemK/MazF family toxin [Actinomycetota bacterium]
MRPIHIAHLDKPRPVVILTREGVRGVMSRVSIAPITSRSKGLPTEVSVGVRNGLDIGSVISCDNIATIRAMDIGRQIGWLLSDEESELARAISHA